MDKVKDIQQIDINTLAKYMQFLEKECSGNCVLFRGQQEQTKNPRSLLPKIARNSSREADVVGKEKRIFADFKKKAIPYIERNLPDNDWEWLTLAQHHGLPTRLLDWSRNPLAALWFAVKKPPKTYTSYGIVWVFKPDESDFVDFSKDKGPFQINKTKVYEPSHIARRITAQSACFTVHKYLDNKSKFIPLNKNNDYKHKLARVTIPGSRFKELNEQLDRCGINDATLFADLDSLCKYLSWKELMFS